MILKIYPNLSPRIIEIRPPTTDITIQELYDALRDWEDEPAHMSYPYLVSGTGKEDLGGGVSVGITITLENARIMFTGRTTPIAGMGLTITTADPTGTNVYASGATFISSGVEPGNTVGNGISGALSTVLEVKSQTHLLTTALSGSFVRNDWQVGDTFLVYPTAQCTISGGNVVAVDENGDTIPVILQSPNVQVVMTSSSSATLQELSSIQYSSFGGGVTVDVVDGVSGTAFPIGTPQQPVNNLTDAMTIAASRGFTTLYILGDMVVDLSGDYSSMIFVGESMTRSHLTISSGANVKNAEFYDAYVTGVLDGNARLKGCKLDDLDYVYGVVEQCMLDPGAIVLGGSNPAHFLDCWSGVPGSNTPTIDCGGSGQSLALRNYNGGIKLINKTGADPVSIDLNSGHVILDSTVTAGEIVIRGVGKLTDNSQGASVDSTHLLSPDNIGGGIGGIIEHNATRKVVCGSTTTVEGETDAQEIEDPSIDRDHSASDRGIQRNSSSRIGP